MKDILHSSFLIGRERGWKSAILAAFNLATMSARRKKLRNSDFLQIHQFRRLLLALKQYFEFYEAYSKIDNDKDNQLSFEEFKLAGEILVKWSGHVEDWKASFN
jgi:hypothetical protein